VAGQQPGFFSEAGFTFPPFPFVAHAPGSTAEDMDRNVAYVKESRREFAAPSGEQPSARVITRGRRNASGPGAS
jgi:hypothetical protein